MFLGPDNPEVNDDDGEPTIITKDLEFYERKRFFNGFPPIATSHKRPEIKPGQIWTTKTELSGIDLKGRFINPIEVIILETLQDFPGVKVAQLYPMPQAKRFERNVAFESNRDVSVYLSADRKADLHRTNLPDFRGDAFFAEPWNVYTLKRDDLGGYIDETDDKTVDKIKKEHQWGHWGKPAKLIAAFRQKEIEIAYFFSSRAVMEMVDELESGGQATV